MDDTPWGLRVPYHLLVCQ